MSAVLARVAVNPIRSTSMRSINPQALLNQSLNVDLNYKPTREARAIMHNELDEMRKIVQATAKN